LKFENIMGKGKNSASKNVSIKKGARINTSLDGHDEQNHVEVQNKDEDDDNNHDMHSVVNDSDKELDDDNKFNVDNQDGDCESIKLDSSNKNKSQNAKGNVSKVPLAIIACPTLKEWTREQCATYVGERSQYVQAVTAANNMGSNFYLTSVQSSLSEEVRCSILAAHRKKNLNDEEWLKLIKSEARAFEGETLNPKILLKDVKCDEKDSSLMDKINKLLTKTGFIIGNYELDDDLQRKGFAKLFWLEAATKIPHSKIKYEVDLMIKGDQIVDYPSFYENVRKLAKLANFLGSDQQVEDKSKFKKDLNDKKFFDKNSKKNSINNKNNDCWICGKYGHKAKDCRLKNVEGNSQSKGVPQFKDKDKKMEKQRRIRQNNNSCDGYMIIGNNKVPVILDSGADNCLIGEGIAKIFNSMKNCDSNAYWGDGTPINIIGTINLKGLLTDNAVKDDSVGVEIEIEALVTTAQIKELIIGRPILEKLGIDVNAQLKSIMKQSIFRMIDHVDDNENDDIDSISDENVQVVVNDDNNDIEMIAKRSHYPIPNSIKNALIDLKSNENDNIPMDVIGMPTTLKKGWKPILIPPRRRSHLDSEFLEKQTIDMLDKDQIYHNPNSRFVSEAHIVHKNGVPNRMTIDLREVNKMVEDIAINLPDMETAFTKIGKAIIFSKIDLKKGYFQMMHQDENQDVYSFRGAGGRVFTPKRVSMGAKNAPHYFQNAMQNIFIDMENVIVWLDDILIYSDNLNDHEQSMLKVINKFKDKNIKIKWEKTYMFVNDIEFLGRKISKTGIKFSDDHISGITNMDYPKTYGDLHQFIHSCNYMRTGIPNFEGSLAPLRELMDIAHKKAGNRKKRPIQNIQLNDDWKPIHCEYFDMIKNMVKKQITLAVHDPNKKLYIISDASDTAWSLIIGQDVNDNDEDDNQSILDKSIQILVCASGIFKDATKNYETISKEMFPLKYAIERYSYLLHRKKGFNIYSDNKTLVYLLNGKNNKDSMGRIYRWLEKFIPFNYKAHHIDGENNFFADMLTRWSNSLNKLTYRKIQSENIIPKNLQVNPNEDEKLKIIQMAHNGFNGHRGIDGTLKIIKRDFDWKNLKQDVKNFIDKCLPCIVAKNGSMLPREMGQSLAGKAEKPNEIINVDFLTMHDRSKESVLVVKDSLSLFTYLYVVDHENTSQTINSITHWISSFGVPKIIVSDNAKVFTSNLFNQVLKEFNIDSHQVAAYLHSANSAERANRIILEITKALLVELHINATEWKTIIPMVQRIINNSPSRKLNGLTPIEVFTRIKPQSMLCLLQRSIPDGNVQQKLMDKLNNLVNVDDDDELFKAVKKTNDIISGNNMANRKYKSNSFKVNDKVLIWYPKKHKLIPNYFGPFIIREKINNWTFRVENVKTKQFKQVHSSRMVLYNNDDDNDVQTSNFIQHGSIIEEIRNIKMIKFHDENVFEFQVKLIGIDNIKWWKAEIVLDHNKQLLIDYCNKNHENSQVKLFTEKYSIQTDVSEDNSLNGGNVVTSTRYKVRNNRYNQDDYFLG